jgi:general nucleoside transport system permease protein
VLLRLEPRLSDPSAAEWAARTALGLILALLLAALVIALAGYDALSALTALWRGAFGSLRAVAATVNKAVPIGLCAMGIALAYRARLWNIGAEGQLYLGAFAATGVGLALPETAPAPLAVAAVLLAGMIAGASWAMLAALPRAYLGMNEILSTLMLTYVAILWVGYLVTGPWADPLTFSFPYSEPIPAVARLGQLAGGIHGGVLVLAVVALLLAAVDRGLRWGYELRVAGDAPRAAIYGGISPIGTVLTAMLAAGALAGLAGAIEVSASTGRLQAGLSPGYGFMAILVAWLAAGSPLGIVMASILYAGLQNGGFALQVAGIPPAITVVLQAVLLLAALAVVGLGHYRIRLVRRVELFPQDGAAG